MAARRFRPTWWGTVLALVGIAAGIQAALWQTGRAQEKQQIADAMAQRATAPAIHVGTSRLKAEDVEYRTVEARGRFEPRGLVYLDNRVHKGRVGYEVVMPLRMEGSDVLLLVNRGWVAGTGDRQRLPEIRTPEGLVEVTGIAVVPGTKMYELSETAIEGSVWQNLSTERYTASTGYEVQPVLVRQTNDVPDGLIRDWTVSDRAINVHRSYAFQWYALAALVLVVYLAMSFKRDPANS
jgi:surfeit locus 1 family protein